MDPHNVVCYCVWLMMMMTCVCAARVHASPGTATRDRPAGTTPPLVPRTPERSSAPASEPDETSACPSAWLATRYVVHAHGRACGCLWCLCARLLAPPSAPSRTHKRSRDSGRETKRTRGSAASRTPPRPDPPKHFEVPPQLSLPPKTPPGPFGATFTGSAIFSGGMLPPPAVTASQPGGEPAPNPFEVLGAGELVPTTNPFAPAASATAAPDSNPFGAASTSANPFGSGSAASPGDGGGSGAGGVGGDSADNPFTSGGGAAAAVTPPSAPFARTSKGTRKPRRSSHSRRRDSSGSHPSDAGATVPNPFAEVAPPGSQPPSAGGGARRGFPSPAPSPGPASPVLSPSVRPGHRPGTLCWLAWPCFVFVASLLCGCCTFSLPFILHCMRAAASFDSHESGPASPASSTDRGHATELTESQVSAHKEQLGKFFSKYMPTKVCGGVCCGTRMGHR